MTDLRHAKRWFVALLALVAVAAVAQAETFPSKTIRIIVPYAPGGSVDLTARVVAKNLQDSIGQSVIVENKPGANAAIGIDALVRSEPDGHTIIILSDSPVTINVHLARVNYDPLNDLVPITRVVSSPILMAANAKAGIASIPDLVTAAKAKPLSYAVAGRGSSSNLAAELLQRELKIKMEAVPYRGGAPAAAAVAAGDVPLGLFDTASVLPMIGGGQLARMMQRDGRRMLPPRGTAFRQDQAEPGCDLGHQGPAGGLRDLLQRRGVHQSEILLPARISARRASRVASR